MPNLTILLIEFIIMAFILMAIWFVGKENGIKEEKLKETKERSDAVSRGLSAGNNARNKFNKLHKS